MTMRRISSSMSYHFKRTFPIVMFGAFSAALVAALLQRPVPVETVGVFAVAIVVGGVVTYRYLRDVLDEVYDDGDRLLVRNGGVEDTVQLRDVVAVDSARWRTLVRLTLTLSVPGKFGDKIVFLLRDTFLDGMPYGAPAQIKQLEDRIAALKRNSTGQQ
ncbi:hypothetical protein ASE35_17700 [Lysobacter sp. Root916]|uniref:hypothetical protein n=1 Tax=Lysobacter sp. Root916 TaxID=1736606 RepID=UPI00070F6F56|nr:hypothetical protein [Lysobacter sp. Root916]KRD30546.1 hypothetical protein ASE35_17700 [Lysobacter sp. Root916]